MLGVGGVAIVGATRSGSEAIRLAKELQLDVVLADIDLGGESGLDLARALAALAPAPIVVLISTQTEAEVAERLDTVEQTGETRPTPAIGAADPVVANRGSEPALINGDLDTRIRRLVVLRHVRKRLRDVMR